MVRELNNNEEQQSGSGNIGNYTNEKPDTFNELSELSLEERMAVADQIGIPANNVGEAAKTGTTQFVDNNPATDNTGIKKEYTSEEGGQ